MTVVLMYIPSLNRLPEQVRNVTRIEKTASGSGSMIELFNASGKRVHFTFSCLLASPVVVV